MLYMVGCEEVLRTFSGIAEVKFSNFPEREKEEERTVLVLSFKYWAAESPT